MRMGVIAAGIAAASAVSGTTATSANARCWPPGARTLVADRVARVYEAGGSVYGCADSSGQRYLLAASPTSPGRPHIGKVALAGVDAAYGETTSGVDTISAEVIVRRLDDGRTLHDVAASNQPLPAEYFESVSSLVVKADGAVAWISQAGSILQSGSETELDRVDRRGEARIDHSMQGDIWGLKLRGSRLSWRRGRAVRIATLL